MAASSHDTGLNDKQPGLIALTAVLLGLSTLVLLFRCWIIFVERRKAWWHDYFAIATWPFIVIESCAVFWWIANGLGEHKTEVPSDRISRFRSILHVEAMTYEIAITLPKISVLFFYFLVFRRTSRWFYYGLWILGACSVISGIIGFFLVLFQCKPLRKDWVPDLPGTCLSWRAVLLGTCLANVAIDFSILLLPMPLLWRMHARLSKRLTVMTAFFFGYCVPVLSIGRLIATILAGNGLDTDPWWYSVDFMWWLQCEAPISLISISLPTLFSYFRKVHDFGWRYTWTGEEPTPAAPDMVDRGSMSESGETNEDLTFYDMLFGAEENDKAERLARLDGGSDTRSSNGISVEKRLTSRTDSVHDGQADTSRRQRLELAVCIDVSSSIEKQV